jgi:MFS family permease
MAPDLGNSANSSALGFGDKVVILLSGVLAALALIALNSVLPLIDATLAHTPFESMLVKQLIGGVALAMVVGAAVGGLLTDWLGLRRMLTITSLIYAISGTAGLYLGSLRALLVSRLFVGLTAASIQIVSLTLINTRLQGNERAKWMGIHFSTAMFGTLLLHPIAGALGSLGWRWPFALYALGLVLVPAMMLERKSQSTRPAAVTEEKLTGHDSRGGVLSWFPFRYLLLALMIGALVFLPSVYLPFLLRQVKGSTPWVISLVLTADSVIGAAMAMTYGRARRSLTSTQAFEFCFASIALGTLMASRSTSFAGIVVGMGIYGLGIGWLLANIITSLASKVSLERQGRAVGIVKAVHFSAAPLSIVLIEPFARRYGPGDALLVVSVCAFILLGLFAFRQLTVKARVPLPQ